MELRTMLGVLPRSVRNFNPGNLEHSSIEWLGLASPAEMTAEQRAEQRFCVFRAAKWGFRALALDLFTSWTKGRRTVREIVGRFALPNENDTKAYVDAVSSALNVSPAEPLHLDDDAQLPALAREISVHEAGGWFFDDGDLAEGVQMARLRPEGFGAASPQAKTEVYG
jgi:hypothetical protein